jgi:hypothetical protein
MIDVLSAKGRGAVGYPAASCLFELVLHILGFASQPTEVYISTQHR